MFIQRAYFASLALFLGLAAQACADDDAEGESQATAGVCMLGHEGCPCGQGGACLVGLQCISNACIDPSTVDSTSSSASATDGSGGSAGDDGLCMKNSDCASDEVCYSDACILIDDLYFEVAVYSFEPPSCADGWGDAELYFDFFQGGEFISSSSISGCPGEWWDEPVHYDPHLSFQLDFWESDAFDDDFLTTLCWGNVVCEEVPDAVLRDRWWTGPDSSGDFSYVIEFAPTFL